MKTRLPEEIKNDLDNLEKYIKTLENKRTQLKAEYIIAQMPDWKKEYSNDYSEAVHGVSIRRLTEEDCEDIYHFALRRSEEILRGIK